MSQPSTDPCEVSPVEKTRKRLSRLAVASFVIAAFVPLLFLVAYCTPWYLQNELFAVFELDGNLAVLLAWLILPGIGFVLGVKANGQCAYHALAGRGWATAGISLSIITGIALAFITHVNSSTWPHDSGFYCGKNIRQLSMAALMYAEDHQGKLPRTWADLDRYIPSRYVLSCPYSSGEATTGYGLNQAVTGKKISSIADSDSVVLFADSSNADGVIRSRADIDDQRHETGPGHGLYWHIGPWPRVFVVSYVNGRATILKPGAHIHLNP